MQLFGKRKPDDNKPTTETTETKDDQTTQPPPRPPLPQQSIGFETVIGAGCTIEGEMISKGNIRIDGVFTGTLEIGGNVLVGETAQINADIDAKNTSIAGKVRGNVSGNRVQLLRTARVWGDIRATALSTEEGAFIDGKISMTSAQPTFEETEAEDDDHENVEDTAIIQTEEKEETEEAKNTEEEIKHD